MSTSKLSVRGSVSSSFQAPFLAYAYEKMPIVSGICIELGRRFYNVLLHFVALKYDFTLSEGYCKWCVFFPRLYGLPGEHFAAYCTL